MEIRLKRFLSLLLTLVMVISLMPANLVFAAEEEVVAEVNGVGYTDLQEAIDAAAAGDTVTLLDNVTLDEGIVIAADDVIILELNGKTISRNTALASSTAAITNNGNLTVQDAVGGGKITAFASNPDTAGIPYYASNTITNCGVLTLNSGTIENSTSDDARAAFPIDNNSTSRDAIVNISGGTVTGRGAIRQFANSNTNKNEVNITAGTVSGSSYGIWMQNPGSGDPVASLNISGGEIAKVLISPSASFAPSITGGQVSEVAIWAASGDAARDPSGFISGGTIGGTVDASFIKEGYTLGEDGKVVEAEKTFVKDEETKTATISDLAGLKAFAAEVNAGNTFDNWTITLSADIDLLSEPWTPIGNGTNKFLGTFDGADHTISNLVVDVDTNNAGLFGFASVVKNVNLVNAKVSGVICVGALVGELESSVGTVDNCSVSGTVQITGENSVGGLAGKGYANIKNCTVTGDADSFVLGVYGNTEEGDNVGGIIGHLGEGNTLGVANSTVKNIKISGTRKVGGIVGTTARANDMVGNAVENITVECTATADYADANASTTTIGGIVGNYFGTATSGGILQDSTVTNLTFVLGNAKSAGALAGGDRQNNGGAPVGVEASENTVTNVTGATNNYLLPAYVAEVNGEKYTDLQEAIVAAAPNGTVELLSDVTVDKWIMFSQTLSVSNGNIITLDNIDGLTIDGNGYKLTVKSIESAGNGNRLFYDADNLNIQDLTIECVEAAAKQGGIGLTSGTISNVTFNGGVGVLPGTGNITITGCTFKTDNHAIYYEEERDNLVVDGNTFELADNLNVILLRGDTKFTNNTVISGRTVNVVSGSPMVSGNNFNDVRLKVYNEATAAISGNTINNLVFNDETVPAATFTNNTLSAEAQAALDAVTPDPVAQVGETTYTSVLDAMAAAIEAGASKVKLLADSRELMPRDIEWILNADLTITADVPVKVAFNNEGTAYDIVVNSNNNNKLTIGNNVHIELEDRVIWLGYYGNNVDVIVEGTLEGYQIWHGADTTVTETGTLIASGEAMVLRRGATLTVDGGTIDANYFSILSGNIDAKNATIVSGPIWVSNTGNYDNEGGVSLKLDNSTWTSSGNIKLASEKTATLELTNGSVVTTVGASVIDANSAVVADSTSSCTASGNSVFVATVGEMQYTSLQSALNAAADGNTVKLLTDLEISETIVVETRIVLDLNGKTLSTNTAATLLENRAPNFWIRNTAEATAKIVNTVADGVAIWNRAALLVSDKNILIDASNGTAFNSTGAGLIAAGTWLGNVVHTGFGQLFSGGEYSADVTAYCSDGYAALPTLDGTFVVGEKPTATVNNLGAMTVPAGDYYIYDGSLTTGTEDLPLNFVMQFVADQDAEDMQTSPYASWYADFVITFEGIEGGSFNPSGCYLAGYYGSTDSWDGLWVKIPVEGVLTSIDEGTRYPVMMGVDMPQTYDYICSGVQAFSCAMYIPEEILTANPNLKVNLELNIVDSSNDNKALEALTTGEGIYMVSETTYTVEDFEEKVAQIGTTRYSTLTEAVEAAAKGDTIVLLTDLALSETVKIPAGKILTLDLNGKTITGTDNATGSFGLIENRGDLTITDSAEGGKITLIATNDRDWNAYSSVISNTVGGKLTVEAGTIEHLGGSDMAYGIDNLTNGKGTYAETVINGGTVKSPYRAIRQFLNGIEAQNILTVNGGTIEGANKSIWMQDPSKNANTGTLTVGKNANLVGDVYLFVTAGSTEWPVEVAIAETALAENSEILTGNVPSGYELVKTEGVYGVKSGVAKIGTEYYATLAEAVAAAEAGDTIVLLTDVVLDAPITVKESITLDGAGYSITQSAACNNNIALLYFEGAEGALLDVTVKNVTFDGLKTGAAIRTLYANMTIDSCVFQNCEHTVGQGLVRLTYGNATITGSKFLNNDCSMAVSFNWDADATKAANDTLTIENCEFSGNTANKTALVYYVKGVKCTLNNNKFIGNNVNCADNGAVVYMGFTENNVITGNLFKDNVVTEANTSTRVAGALFFGYETTVTDNAFINNTASNSTGAVLGQVCTSTYYECSIDLSKNYWGGAEPVYGKDYTIQHQTGDANFIVDSYYAAYDEATNTVSELIETNYVAQIGKVPYKTFEAAYAAAQPGETIELLADVTLTGKLTVNKAITIDGNGHSIIANHTAFIVETSADCTFKDVTLNTNNKAKGVKIASGNVVFDNVTIPNSNKSDAITVYGTLTIKNYFSVESTYQVFDARNGVVTAEPGTVFDFTSRIGLASPAKCDFKSVVDTEGNPFFCAYSTTTYYKDLTDTSYSNLTLLDDVELTKDTTLSGTLDLNGHNLTVAEGKVIKINSNTTVTGAGNLAADLVLTSASATLTAGPDLDVTTTEADSRVVYENGVYSVKAINYVAQIGDKKFETLRSAIDAAGEGDTVTLLADINLTMADAVKNAGDYAVLINVSGKSITLDMNGKTISVVHLSTTDRIFAVICVEDGASLTVTGGGKIDVTTDETTPKVAYLFWKRGTTGSLAIKNGNYHMNNSEDSMVYTNGSQIVTVEGGTFTIDAVGSKANGFPCIFNVAGQNQGNIIITGGTFNTDINHQYYAFEALVPKEYALKNNGDNTWSVVDAVAYVGEIEGSYTHNVGYATLEAAIAAADAGETVTLLKDIELTETLAISADKDIVLDLNGKTISGTDTTNASFSLITNKGNLTVKDGVGIGKITLTATQDTGYSRYSTVISNTVGGKLTVESGTIEHLGGHTMAYAIDNLTNGKGTYAETVINGGTVKSSYVGIRQFLNGVEAQNILTVNGGTVTGNNTSIFFQDPSSNCNSGKLFVGGGATLGNRVYVSGTAGTDWDVDFSVSAQALGTYGITTDEIPETAFVKEVNGAFVIIDAVATVNGVGYKNLADAIAGATAGDTVIFIADISEDVTVNKNLTIDGASFNYTGTMTVNTSLNTTFTNINFVKGAITEAKGTRGYLTVKNCSFDGVDKSIGYAITQRGGDKLNIENTTAKNYGYGMVYIPSSVAAISVKDVTVEGVTAAFNISYSGNGTFENVTVKDATYGLHAQNYGARTFTLTGCNLNCTYPVYVQEKGTATVSFALKGNNTFVTDTAYDSQYAKLILDKSAVLTASECFDVIADEEGYVVVYKNGAYTVEKAVAKIGDTYYATLTEAVAAVQEGQTITVLAGELSEGTIKLPATLKNVTIKGENGAILKDMTIMAADGNSYSYEGLTFDGITFENSRLIFTGWRNVGAVIKDLAVTNCIFQNLNDTTNNAPVHINMAAAEAVENFTFTGNVIDSATGGSKSGIYAQVTGDVVVENNTINNVSFRPYVIQVTTDDGIADNFTVTGNTFSGSAAGRAQGLGNNSAGTDTVNLVVSGNIFKDITDAQQICYWSFNPETTTADLSKNYYDIDILNNPSRIYYNSAAADAEDLIEMGVYPYYADEAMTTLVTAPAIMVTYPVGNPVYPEGKVEYYNNILDAVPYTTNCPRLEGATIKLLSDIEGAGIRMMENDMVLDLNGHTYTIVAGTGSQGTNTSGFQIRPEVTTVATIKNGTIQVAEGAPVVWMFNVYATDFVVEDVIVDCANMAYSYGESCYVSVSREGDNVQFTGNTQIKNFNSEVAGAAYSNGGTMTFGEGFAPNGTIVLGAGATLTAGPDLDVTTTVADSRVVYKNGVYSVEAIIYVAQVNGVKYETLAEALTAANDGDTITLIWNEGDAPIAMNGAVYGKSVTITGTATVDWSKGFLFVGRGGEGNGTVIFDGANLTSASNNASTGIHVSGREKNTNNKYDGTLVINNSTIELDYLINKGAMTLNNATLTVKNGFSIGGRPASETESGVDATATVDLTNGSKIVVNNHNGMGLGYEAIGVMNIDETSAFETTQSFKVTAKGTMNIAGTATVAGTLTNDGSIVLTDKDATLTSSECGNVTTTVVDYEVVYENGTYKVNELPDVAKIGEVGYKSLQAAIDAAAEGDTVTVLADITLTETVTVPADKTITLDLNGKTINGGWDDETAGKHIYAFTNNGDLTITGNGTINARGNNNYGKLTLESGTINAIDANGGYAVRSFSGATFTMNGGIIAATNEDGDAPGAGYDATTVRVDAGATFVMNDGELKNISNFTFAIDNSGTTTVNGGKISSVHTTVANYDDLTINGGEFTCDGLEGVTAHVIWADAGKTTINGGTFDGKDNFNGFNVDASAGATVEIKGGNFLSVHSGSLYGEGTIAVSGGKFFDPVAEDRCADGYIPKDNGDGTYGVKEGSYVARNTTTGVGYETFEAAYAAAQTGETIELLAPIVVQAGETLTLDKNITISYTSNVAGEDMITNKGTLNIGGEIKITYNNTDNTGANVTVSTISCEPGSVLNITGGTVENKTVKADGSSIYSYAIDLLTNGNLGDVTATISGGTVYSDYMAIRQFNNGEACKNTLNVTGGYIYGAKRAIQVHLKNNAAYTNITGGKVEGGDYSLCFLTTSENLTVSGGEFIGAVWYSGTDGFISGGIFDQPVAEEYCAEGYIPTEYENGTYGVKVGSYVAQVGDKKFETLAEAVAAVAESGVIELLADFDGDFVIVRKQLTVMKNGFAINGEVLTTKGLGSYEDDDKLVVVKMDIPTADAGEKLAYIDIDNDGYVDETLMTLQAALDAAADGETVKLLGDLTVNAVVIIPNNVTLDIEKNVLTVNAMIALNGGKLLGAYDSAKNDGVLDGGLLKVARENLVLNAEAATVNGATVLPVWDPTDDNQCYRFSQIIVNTDPNKENRGLHIDKTKDTISFHFKNQATTDLYDGLMKNYGGTELGFSVIARIQWEEKDTEGNDIVEYHNFVYSDETIKLCATDYQYFFSIANFSLMGIDLDTLEVQATFVTDSGATAYSETWTIANADVIESGDETV